MGNRFEKFADTQGQHVTTLRNQISQNFTNAMSTSHNPRIDQHEGTKKHTHSSRDKPREANEEHNKRKCQKLRNNSCRDKTQIQEKRKVREVSRSESSEND